MSPLPTPAVVAISPLVAQLIQMLAAGLLLISFAMLTQRRTQRLIVLFAAQGAILCATTFLVAHSTGRAELYLSGLLTLSFKAVLLPWILFRLVRQLGAQWESEPLVNIPTTMLVGLLLVIFSFGLSGPISRLTRTITGHTIGIALAVVLLAFLMMITRRKAVTQVMGFLAMENGLYFAATGVTYGMPMAVELGIAFDLLVAVLILGVFFFQIREQFDSLDLHHLESLKEE